MSTARPPSPARSSTRLPARPAGQGSQPRSGPAGGGLHRSRLTPARKAPNMQPSTHQTAPGAGVAGLPAGLLALVVAAGSAGLFATFWDDALHTHLGPDQATIPPHLRLYASMATIGAVVAAWGLSALWRDRSPTVVWRQPPLLLAAAGGTVTLAALPIDAAWHASFG